MIDSRRVLIGTVCVEAVAAVGVLTQGYFALIAVAVLYWIDLLCVTFRAIVQQVISRPVTDRETLFQTPLRLLAHKRGSVSVTDRLPPFYPRNLPGIVGVSVMVFVSMLTTAYVAVVTVPSEFWTDPTMLLLLAAGVVAAAAKSWLVLRAYIEAGVYKEIPAYVVAPGKRVLVFAIYAALLWLATEWTVTTLTQEGIEIARAGMTVSAAVVIIARVAYGTYASRSGFSTVAAADDRANETTDSDDGLVSRLRSALSAEHGVFVPSTPSVPDGTPLDTVEPNRRSILTAGVVNAMTTGGVVDGQFGHWRQFAIPIGVVGVAVVAVLALLDGAVVVSVVLAGIFLGSVLVLSALSAVHMLLALAGVEYRFYDSEIVAYDRCLGEPQWSASYDRVRNISVERGLFGSPLWVDAGTVAFDRPERSDGRTFVQQEPRSSIPFVSEPDRVGEILRSRGGRLENDVG